MANLPEDSMEFDGMDNPKSSVEEADIQYARQSAFQEVVLGATRHYIHT